MLDSIIFSYLKVTLCTLYSYTILQFMHKMKIGLYIKKLRLDIIAGAIAWN